MGLLQDYDGRWALVDGFQARNAPPQPWTLFDTRGSTMATLPSAYQRVVIDRLGAAPASKLTTADLQRLDATVPTPPAIAAHRGDPVPALFVANPKLGIVRVVRGAATWWARDVPHITRYGPVYREYLDPVSNAFLFQANGTDGCGERVAERSGSHFEFTWPGHDHFLGAGVVLGNPAVVRWDADCRAATHNGELHFVVQNCCEDMSIHLGSTPGRGHESTSWGAALLAEISPSFTAPITREIRYYSLADPPTAVPPAPRLPGTPFAAAVAPDARSLAVLTSAVDPAGGPVGEWTLAIVDIATGAVRRQVKAPSFGGGVVPQVAFDGRWVAVGAAGSNDAARVFDTAFDDSVWQGLPGPGGVPTFDRVMGS